MTSSVNQLEDKLGQAFKGVPDMPENGRKAIVQYMPWIALVVGVLSLWLAWGVWQAATLVNTATSYLNALSNYYGVPSAATTSGWTLWLMLSFVILAAEGVLYLLAFPGLRTRKKAGWDMLFYGALVNLAYAVIALFAFPNDGFARLVGGAVGSAIGFYFLYQIRSYYGGKKVDAKK